MAAAYALHAVSLGYLTVLKTYGLSNLLFICALLLVVPENPNGRRAAIAGACAALAVGLRLPTAAVLAVLSLWTLRSGVRPAAAFAAGATIAGVPLLVIAGQDPQAFWFGNVGFHELRRERASANGIAARSSGE